MKIKFYEEWNFEQILIEIKNTDDRCHIISNKYNSIDGNMIYISPTEDSIRMA